MRETTHRPGIPTQHVQGELGVTTVTSAVGGRRSYVVWEMSRLGLNFAAGSMDFWSYWRYINLVFLQICI